MRARPRATVRARARARVRVRVRVRVARVNLDAEIDDLAHLVRVRLGLGSPALIN